jgi:hypothetical protein
MDYLKIGALFGLNCSSRSDLTVPGVLHGADAMFSFRYDSPCQQAPVHLICPSPSKHYQVEKKLSISRLECNYQHKTLFEHIHMVA